MRRGEEERRLEGKPSTQISKELKEGKLMGGTLIVRKGGARGA